MKLPNWIEKIEVVCTKPGIYTPMITYHGNDINKAQRWIEKNGRRWMNFMCVGGVKDYASK